MLAEFVSLKKLIKLINLLIKNWQLHLSDFLDKTVIVERLRWEKGLGLEYAFG